VELRQQPCVLFLALLETLPRDLQYLN
jgi:hypothetical protein